MYAMMVIDGTPFGLPFLHNHTQTLHVGAAKCACYECNEDSQVMEKEGDILFLRTNKSGCTNHSDEQHEPYIRENKGPETEHGSDADWLCGHMTCRHLPCHAQQDGHHGTHQQGRDAGMECCHPAEESDTASQGMHQGYACQKQKQGKTILDVESAVFQYGMMAGYSEELQALLLESSVASVDQLEESKEELMELVQAWAKGDEAEFDALINAAPEFESPEEEALYNEYQNAMVTQRNLSMADFAEDALKSGEEVFIVVGAAHIVGAGAMAELLAQRGYTVEIVRY